ncbi:MAG: hypothetical protein GX268_01055, partial [Methanomicrobiales archaeon]|nr:hypothetical protein [Methanomicrobiales archaeon]
MNSKKIKNRSFFPDRNWYLFCILGGILLACTGPVFGASAPDITALSPDSVHAGFSYLVTLSGQGFTDNMTIGFGQDDNALNVTDMKFISDEKVTFRVITPSDAKPGFYQMILSSPVFGEQKYNQVFHVRPP